MNVVPTPATRKVANYAIAHARSAENGADAALRWLPEVHPDQLVAFVGLVLGAASARPSAHRRQVESPSQCLDCAASIQRSGHGRRGLCRRCYDHHRYVGDLEKFQPINRLRSINDDEAREDMAS